MRLSTLGIATLSLLVLSLPTLQAQSTPRAGASPNTRYARAISRLADSVLLISEAANEEVGRLGAGTMNEGTMTEIARTLREAGEAMRTLAGDFEAIVPPADLARLHEQLTGPLTQMANDFYEAGLAFQSRGNDPRANLQLTQRAGLKIAAADRASQDYLLARDRARRMLAPKGVRLSEYRGTSQLATPSSSGTP